MFAAVLAALAAGLFILSSTAGWATRFEHYYQDVWHRLADKRFEPRHVALAIIDDATLAHHADTPLAFWTPHFAHAVATLRGVGVRLVVLDFIFSGSPELWLARLGVTDREAARNYDRDFRAAIGAGDVVLAAFLVGSGRDFGDFVLPSPDLLLSLPRQDVAGHVGLANLHPDVDSVVRQYRLRLPIAAAMQAEGLPYRTLAGTVVRILRPDSPDSEEAERPITYAGPPGSFPVISFARLLAPHAAEDPAVQALAGKVVVIGTSYAGANDVHATPYSTTMGAGDRLMSGPELQANIIETALTDRLTRRAGAGWLALPVFFGAWGCAFLLLRHGFPLAFAAYLTFCAVCVLVAYRAFFDAIFIDALQIQAAPLFALIPAVARRFGKSERERRRLEALFGRYVSERVLQALVDGANLPALGGTRREITILFSDIRGFTTYSELLTPEEVVELLNEYFQHVCAALLAEEATIDKFIGDAVMAEFGAPLEQADHADRALRAALAIRHSASDFANWMKMRFPDRSLPPFEVGIGIHTGMAVVGNIGSRQRMEYTAVGDTVNIASRLEGMTKTVGSPILISRATYDALTRREALRFGKWRSLTIRGKRQTVDAIEVHA